MGRKCCVTGCNSNYSAVDKVTVYRLPRDLAERERWIKAIPRDNIPNTPNTVVCIKHFPEDFETVSVKGRLRPKDPPSIFPNVPKSLIPTPPPLPRSTTKSSSTVRCHQPDELDEFSKRDIVDFDTLCSSIPNRDLGLQFQFTSFVNNKSLSIQSVDYLHSSGIPRFVLRISPDQSFEGYHAGVKMSIVPLSKNRITSIDRWSQLEAALNYLNSLELSHKKSVMLEQCSTLNAVSVKNVKYSPDVIVRAFEYLATSRSLYNRLREDFGLPSQTTLNRISSKVNNTSDLTFLKSVFCSLKEQQRKYVLLIDEVYVKPLLTYHGGKLFGKSVNKPEDLATTVLGFMLVSLYGAPSFLVKMLPVHKLDSQFMFDQTQELLSNIKQADGSVVSIICDNNRINQSFFKLFPLKSPWETTDNIFLLYDFVHVMKNIRNNWLTEKTGQIVFEHDGAEMTAKWEHIIKLQKLEDGGLMKMSKLNYQSANPKPIERQKVQICLNVFCEETKEALKQHPGMKDENVDGTVVFISKVIEFWKIMNVKTAFEDKRLKDPLRAAIYSHEDMRLKTLHEFADFALQLQSQQGKREKKFTRDTALAIQHTCNGIIELTKYLLESSEFVLLGKFTTDPIEKAFSKLRQGSGGTYFINVQQILEKVNIFQTKVLLRLRFDIDQLPSESGHSCDKCGFVWPEEVCELINNLPDLECSIKDEVKQSLVYIAGYVTRKDAVCDEEEDADTFNYFEKFGSFTSHLDRGGLKKANDFTCQWTIFSYIVFQSIANYVCRKSLSNALYRISEMFDFHVKEHHCHILSNIFFNNLCKLSNMPSHKEPKQKILKLS